MATLSLVSNTYTSIKCQVTGISSQNTSRTFKWFLDGVEKYSNENVSGSTTSSTYNFTGLTAGESYTIKFTYKTNASGKQTFSESGTYSTKSYSTNDTATVTITPSYETISYTIKPNESRDYTRYIDISPGTYSSGGSTVISSGSTTRRTLEYSGYSEDTTRNVTIQITNPDDVVTFKQTSSVTTLKHASATVTGPTSVTIDIAGMSDHSSVRYWQFKTYEVSSGSLVGTTTQTTSATTSTESLSHTDINFLQPSTTYRTDIRYGTNTNYSYSIASVTYTTESLPYTLSLSTSSTYDSVTLTAKIDQAQSTDVPVHFYIKEESASTWRKITTKSISAGNLTESCKFSTDITPATVYYCYIYDPTTKLTIPDNTDGYYKRRTKNNFEWAGSSNIDSGKTFNIIAGSKDNNDWDGSWNDFTSQLKAKEKYFTTTDNRTFTTATKGGNFTAAMFNQAAAAINNIEGKTVIDTVKTGDVVYASVLKDLVTYLNS